MKLLPPRRVCGLAAALLISPASGPGQEAASANSEPESGVTNLDTVLVTAEQESVPVIQGPFLPEIVAGKIFTAKKTTVIDFDAMPQIQTDNYRQAFSRTPGLLVSELPNNSLLSIGSRGIGDPHETQNILVLKDGVPFVMDMFGYPTVYYAPPLEAMDRLEFVRGGSSLLYGPQPGGSINYVTHRPSLDREFGFQTQNLFGSNDLYMNYTSVDGTIGRLSYMLNFNHRSGDSFRDVNSDFELNGGTIMLGLDLDTSTRWLLNVDLYESDSGEPGGLGFGTALDYNVNRNQTQTPFDRVRIKRYFATLALEHDISSVTRLDFKVFGGYSNRTSRRQTGTAFGAPPPAGGTNTINEHRYYTIGTDLRVSHEWSAWGNDHQFAAGMTAGYTYAPLFNTRGASPTAEGGVLFNDILRETSYISFFAENQFRFGQFSIVPAMRFETIRQSLDDRVRLNSGTLLPLPDQDRSNTAFVPLFGLGLAYDFLNDTTLYANFSQGYKPQTYADAVPINNNVAVSDLDPGNTLTYELGYRGQPGPWINWDVSGFLIDYDNRFGSRTAGGTTFVQNVGRSINWGLDVAMELDLIGMWDRANPSRLTDRYGNLMFHVAYEWLNAEFVSGPVNGLSPQYAPEHLFRTGLTYRWKERVKVSFLHTHVSDHFANDNNTANFAIPAYNVFDLTAEAKVWGDNVTLLAGINNLFNEDYYSRIRGSGIDPAYGRNFYAGLRLTY